MNTLPKNHDMQIIEMMYNCLQPEIMTLDNEEVSLLELDRLERTLTNSFEQADFFRALNQLEETQKRVSTLTPTASIISLSERIADSIKEAKQRICPECFGKGEHQGHNNNPYSYDCGYCNGGGLL